MLSRPRERSCERIERRGETRRRTCARSRRQIRIALIEAEAQSAIASQKAAEAADTAAKGLTAPEPPAKPQTFGDIIAHLSPTSIIKAMAEGDVLQIVIFSVIFALAVTAIGKKAQSRRRVVRIARRHYVQIYRIRDEIRARRCRRGDGLYGRAQRTRRFEKSRNARRTLYGALFVFVLFVLLPIALIFKVPLKDFINAVKTPATIAFATTSSESALPKAMENMVLLGVPRRIVGFVLPTGYSFNLDGTTLYLALASIFVAQAAGVELSWTQQIVMLATLMLTSKGVAGVPRASLVILLGTLASFCAAGRRRDFNSRRGRIDGYGANGDQCYRQLSGNGRHRQMGRRVSQRRMGTRRSRTRRSNRTWRDCNLERKKSILDFDENQLKFLQSDFMSLNFQIQPQPR